MNMMSRTIEGKLDLASCQHWSTDLPYRAITAVREQKPNGTILYQVAGSADAPCGARNALKLALKIHSGTCFYCNKEIATETSENATTDHIEPVALGGTNELSNLVVACKPCNAKKGQSTIDAFNPRATKEWLTALRDQIDARLNKLNKRN
jgi:5-methylcytosine-specific restriction endonuclease McrA